VPLPRYGKDLELQMFLERLFRNLQFPESRPMGLYEADDDTPRIINTSSGEYDSTPHPSRSVGMARFPNLNICKPRPNRNILSPPRRTLLRGASSLLESFTSAEPEENKYLFKY
jgi:hypothetical protein